MEPDEKAQVEGQDPSAPEGADPADFLTEQEIEERINSDPEFMQGITSGRIDLSAGIRRDSLETPGAAPADAEKTPAKPAKELDETPPADPGKAEEPPAGTEQGGKVFQLRQEELIVETEDGRKVQFKTPGEVLKSVREKENFIGRLSSENAQFRAKNDELTAQMSEIRKRLDEKDKAADARPENTAGAGAADPAAGEQEDIYDPAYLRKIGMTEKQIGQLRDRLDKIERQTAETARAASREQSIKSTFDRIQQFQRAHQEFSTKAPIEQIDREYRLAIERIGAIAGTDGSQKANYEAARLYLEDETEKGEKLREMAEKNGIRLPDEFDTYKAILDLRAESHNLMKRGADGQPRPFTLDEVYQFQKAQGLIREPENPAPARPAREPVIPPDETEAERRLRIAEEAQKRREKFAADVDPAMSGRPSNVDEMSEEELEQIIDETSPEELRFNPVKLQVYNMALRRLGMKPINPGANR